MNDILSRAILLARSRVGVHDLHVSTRVEKLARYVWHVGTRLKLVKISLNGRTDECLRNPREELIAKFSGFRTPRHESGQLFAQSIRGLAMFDTCKKMTRF